MIENTTKLDDYLGFRTTRETREFVESLVKTNHFGKDRTVSYAINQILEEYRQKRNT